MSKTNNTSIKIKKQYHHLTKEDRIKIELLINQKDEIGKDYLTTLILKIL